MDVRTLLSVLRKYWGSIVLVTLLGAALSGLYIYLTPPTYTAHASVFLSVQGTGSVNDMLQGSNYATSASRSFAEIATTDVVLDQVIDELGLKTTSKELASYVTTSIPTNTSMIKISVVDGHADQAAKIAKSVADSLVKSVKALSPVDVNQRATISATIVDRPTVPESPTSPNKPLVLALGIVAGLAIGFVQALLRKTLDVSVRSEDDVTQATGHSVLARIPFDSSIAKDPTVIINNPQSPIAEEFRRLRTNLDFVSMESESAPIFVVTSSLAAEGKSTTAVNIALSYAEYDLRVLLIDADLRRPRIASYLNIEGSVGLTTVLVGKARLKDVIQRFGPGHLDVLPLGAEPPNPTEVAGSGAMQRLLMAAVQSYDVVIVDSAPLLPVADTTLLASFATGTLLVAGTGRVKIPQLRDAVESLEHSSAPVLGVILNFVSRRTSGYYHSGYYSGYYSTYTSNRNSKGKKSKSNKSAKAAPPRPHTEEIPRRGVA